MVKELIIDCDGNVLTVHTDITDGLLLGHMEISRASEITWDEEHQDWVAEVYDGRIMVDKIRSNLILREQEYITALLRA